MLCEFLYQIFSEDQQVSFHSARLHRIFFKFIYLLEKTDKNMKIHST